MSCKLKEKRLFSTREVAKILQVGELTVRKLIFTGRLRARRVGVLIRIPQDALEKYLEESPCTVPDARRDSRRKGKATLPR